MKLATNQKILLINPHSGNEVGCKVVRVQGPTSALYEIAFEFDECSPGFWLINLPPEDWAVKEEKVNDKHRTPA
jgi:hypothetical protein